MGVKRVLGPFAAVAVLAGCAAAPPAEPPPAGAGSSAVAPAPLARGTEPSPFGQPKPLPVDGAPLDVAAVPGCADGGCEVRFDIALPDGGRFAGVQGSAPGSPGALLVRRTAGGELLTAEPVPGGSVTATAVCDAQRCAAVFGVGAHGSEAVLVDVDDLAVTGRADGGTPGARPIDLDGDDRVDLTLLQSTFEPSYAAAPTYWQTWRQAADGSLEPTGCTPLGAEEPTRLATGPCPPA